MTSKYEHICLHVRTHAQETGMVVSDAPREQGAEEGKSEGEYGRSKSDDVYRSRTAEILRKNKEEREKFKTVRRKVPSVSSESESSDYDDEDDYSGSYSDSDRSTDSRGRHDIRNQRLGDQEVYQMTSRHCSTTILKY